MPRIDEMYAFIAEDSGPEDEGVIAMKMPGNIWMPLVGADMKRMESLRPTARDISRNLGKPVRLIRFTNREELGLIK